MDNKRYYYCVVPRCGSSTYKTPEKRFIHVPKKEEIRKKWIELARGNPTEFLNSRIHFCEDHFDLPNNMRNYEKYQTMRNVPIFRLNDLIPGCLPSKFDCQPDRKKRKRSYVRKQQRKQLDKASGTTAGQEYSQPPETAEKVAGSKMLYKREEKIQIIKWYFSGNSFGKIRELFAPAFENRPVPAASSMSKMIRKFQRCGCINDCRECSQLDIPTEEFQVMDNESPKVNGVEHGISTGVKDEKNVQNSMFDQEILNSEEIKIEDIQIGLEDSEEKLKMYEQESCRTKSKGDDTQNNEFRKDSVCSTGDSSFYFSFDPGSENTAESMKPNLIIKTEEQEGIHEMKIEDVESYHQHIDDEKPHETIETYRAKNESDDFIDMHIQNNVYKM